MVAQHYPELVARQRAEVANGLFSAVHRLRWSADRLAAERERRLRELLTWSVERSPFHAERLAGIDVNRFAEADLPSLPVMTRADLMGNFDQMITDPALTLDVVNTHVDKLDEDDYLLDQYRVIATSGSTGARGLFLYGWEDWTTFVLIATRWHGRGAYSLSPDTTVGTLFASNTRHVSGALHAFLRDLPGSSGPAVTHLPVTLPLPEIVRGLNAAQPTVLQGYPSAMHLLALEAEAGRLKINPKRVLTCGEQCTDEARDAVADAWGVEIYDYWGCSEGVYAFPCKAGVAMHLPDDLAIIEPVDRHGDVVALGQPADKILLTNLYNRTQPLIRYEITDAMTVVDGTCECGCSHRRIADLAGRTDNFFVYDSGAAVHWLGMTTVLLSDPAVVEIQVTQTPHGADVSVATKAECNTESLRIGLVDLMAGAGMADPQVTIRQVDTLDRLWSGKLRQFQPL
ncbi:MAG: phenylacetate--CoA ligase family protein [Acidimicrobiales bacterium]|jgi:phenylacetate-coenzyme A ligase PaaK-like adenylate-forming protein